MLAMMFHMSELCQYSVLYTNSCESSVIFSEASGAIRKTGGDFKEKLRELGGLDAVFEVAKDCHSNMEV